jgi:hypothetical protein
MMTPGNGTGPMDANSHSVRTEVRGFELQLEGSNLVLSAGGSDLLPPIRLTTEEAERLRLEMAKAQLWEWNQLEELKSRAVLRYRRYLASWLVLCLAAFSAYIGYPSYYLSVFLGLLAIFLWWRAGYAEQQADREAQAERNSFIAEWSYLRQRLEESETPPVTEAEPPAETL